MWVHLVSEVQRILWRRYKLDFRLVKLNGRGLYGQFTNQLKQTESPITQDIDCNYHRHSVHCQIYQEIVTTIEM